MYLIVGLGNPGPEYELTPHNLGFLVLDRLAEEEQIRFGWREAESLVGRGTVAGESVLLAKPLSFMNRSGGPVKALLNRYEIDLGRLLVVYDELALPWGELRIRQRGSDAGHHGMESVIAALGSQEVPRLRVGISPGFRVRDGAEFVLRPFRPRERRELDEILARAAGAVRTILSDGAAKAMTVYNRRAGGSNNEGK
jgi:PTH1 family peptidyl-tRNA hydrolase